MMTTYYEEVKASPFSGNAKKKMKQNMETCYFKVEDEIYRKVRSICIYIKRNN